MMISRADQGEFGNWAIIMYSQLVKELIRWDKCQKNMIKGITKKGCMPYAIVLKILFQKWFSLEGAKSHEKKKHADQSQEDKRRRDTTREMFIKNKRPLNLTHIFHQKEKHLETRTTKIAVLMFQFNDDDGRETLQKKQRRQEDTTMKGNINPQQVIELLRK